MSVFSLIKKNVYFDSVTLMGISKRLAELDGVVNVSVSMGTDLNKALLHDIAMNTEQTEAATPNDLMIAFRLAQPEQSAQVLEEIEKALVKRHGTASATAKPAGMKSALELMPDANLVVISLPGEYAAFEAKKALENNLHVLLFSDNVSLEDELALKTLAHEKGLLLMGPDCGTAIINQKALCFANVLSKGQVGVVGASGTGTQEVTVLLDQNGIGVSQVIGTGGRDLSAAINGLMTCDALTALNADPETSLILVVSKPPEPRVLEHLIRHASGLAKPVVLCCLQEGEAPAPRGNISFATTLEQGAQQVIALMQPQGAMVSPPVEEAVLAAARHRLSPGQRYVRGIFCGGTLTEEARILFKRINPSAPCTGNTVKSGPEKLVDPLVSQANCFLDMGDDAFTMGKPHPMIAPELRAQRIAREAADPETAVILFDVVLGYGAHGDPAEITLEGVREAQALAQSQGREIVFVAYVLGTDRDPQHMQSQIKKLEAAGVIVGKTNAHAARIAAELIKGVN